MESSAEQPDLKQPDLKQPEAKQADANQPDEKHSASLSISKNVLYMFLWCMFGISGIYGVRFWQDAPIHPQFVPLIGATFSAVLAFTLVFTLKLVEGPVDFEFGEKVKMKGATGPILMWCVCFLTITYGLYLMGITDVAKKDPLVSYVPCRVTDAVATGCAKTNNEQVAVQKPQEK